MASDIVVNDSSGAKRRDERHAHRRVRNVAQDTPVQRAHRIGVSRGGVEPSPCLSISERLD